MQLMPSLNKELLGLARSAIEAVNRLAKAIEDSNAARIECADHAQPSWPQHAPVQPIDQREGWQR